MNDLKDCTSCKKTFPATDEYFYKDTRKEGRLIARCIQCVNNKRMESYRKKNEDKINKKQQEKERLNPEPGKKLCKKCSKKLDATTEFLRK